MAQSIEQLKQAIEQAQQLSDKASEQSFRRELAQVYIAADQHEDAITELSLVVRLAHDMGDKLVVARTMLLVGEEYTALGNHSRAAESYEYAATIGKMFGNDEIVNMARSRKMLVAAATTSSATAPSSSSLLPSSDVDHLIEQPTKEQAKLASKDRVIERDGSEVSEAEVQTEAPQPEMLTARVASSFDDRLKAGLHAYNNGRVSEARTLFAEVLEQAQSQDDKVAQSQAHFHLGTIEANLRQFDRALERLQDAVGLTVKTKDYALRLKIFDAVISIYDKQGDAEGIQGILRSKLELIEKHGTKADELDIIMQMAVMHRAHGNINDALYKYEDALALAEQAGLHEVRIDALLQSGDIYIESNFAQLSVQRFRDALAAAGQIRDRRREARSLVELARAYSITNDLDDGIQQANEAIVIASALKANRLEGLAHFWLSKLASSKGDGVMATRADKKAQQLLGVEYDSLSI